MTILHVLLVLLLLAILAIAAYRIARLPLSRQMRGLLLFLRTAIIAALAIALFEPTVVLERLPRPRRDVPVLLDASESMSLFVPDSQIRPALRAFTTWNTAHRDSRRRFSFFLFGDSLRALDPESSIRYTDKKSLFPRPPHDHALRDARTVVIVSDGNWANTCTPAPGTADQNRYYLPLPIFREAPWIRLDLEEFPAQSVADSPLVVKGTLQGVLAQSHDVSFRLFEKGRPIGAVSLSPGTGYFKRPVQLLLGPRAPGRHLYRFDAMAPGDSLAYSTFRIHTAVPSRFTWMIAPSPPSLDRRFVRTALERRTDFTETTSRRNAPPDLLVAFTWDSTTRILAKRLPPHGIVLCIGCLPVAATPLALNGSVAYFRPYETPAFAGIDLTSLPPPTRVFSAAGLFKPRDIMLAARHRQSGNAAIDTFPLVVQGRHGDRSYIACAFSDVWRFDFLPLSVAPEEERSFVFLDKLLGLTAETIAAQLADGFYLYPSGPLSDGDSLRLRVVFPARIAAGSTVHMSCVFSQNGTRPYDTSFDLTVTGSAQQSVGFAPIAVGTWSMAATVTSKQGRYAFTDSLVVNKDRSELMVSGQNRQLLDGIARPLHSLADSALSALVLERHDTALKPLRESFTLHRGWALLTVLFVLLAAEWLLRRLLRLD